MQHALVATDHAFWKATSSYLHQREDAGVDWAELADPTPTPSPQAIVSLMMP